MRSTLYFVTGTHSILDILGQGIPQISDPSTTWPSLIDASIWNVVPITYAASLLPLAASGTQGVTRLIAQINSTPGRFALAGISQGAWVTSRVMMEIASGSLQSRAADFIAGVTWGSPTRMTNHTYPGQVLSGAFDIPNSTTGGHGCLEASQRMTSVPTNWADYANSLDPICSVGDSTVGKLWTRFCTWFAGHYVSGDLITLAFQELGTLFTHPAAIVQLLQDVATYTGSAQGHNYLVPPPGAPAGSKTMMELGADYLNSLGAAQSYSGPAWAALSAGTFPPPP